MVKIIPFKCYYPLSLTDYVLPMIFSDIDISTDVKSIDENDLLKIPANVVTRDQKRIFQEILTLGHSRKYEALRRHWSSYESLGFFKEEEDALFYAYRMEYTLQNVKHSQIGLICCLELRKGTILGHENTLEDKILDQVERLESLRTSISPVFLLYKDQDENFESSPSNDISKDNLAEILERVTFSFPIIDLIASNGVRHSVWKIADPTIMSEIVNTFGQKNKVYVADGHHRIESSFSLMEKLKQENPNHTGNENYNFILSAIFPASKTHILEYNRIIKNVKKFKKEIFPKLKDNFKIVEIPQYKRPETQGKFLIYTRNRWFKVKPKDKINSSLKTDVEKLESFIIQKYIFNDIFKIKDVRNSNKILYIPGNRSIKELISQTDKEGGMAFILPPIHIKEILTIADQNQIVPPKSTWFEPKLLKGIMYWKF